MNKLATEKPSATIPEKKNKGYAFISYASEDFEFLEDLKKFLAEAKHGYWNFLAA